MRSRSCFHSPFVMVVFFGGSNSPTCKTGNLFFLGRTFFIGLWMRLSRHTCHILPFPHIFMSALRRGIYVCLSEQILGGFAHRTGTVGCLCLCCACRRCNAMMACPQASEVTAKNRYERRTIILFVWWYETKLKYLLPPLFISFAFVCFGSPSISLSPLSPSTSLSSSDNLFSIFSTQLNAFSSPSLYNTVN